MAPFWRPDAICRRRSSASSFFDRYQGKGVPDGAVSLSVRLTFQAADRTLTDAEVQQSVEAILAALIEQHARRAALTGQVGDIVSIDRAIRMSW